VNRRQNTAAIAAVSGVVTLGSVCVVVGLLADPKPPEPRPVAPAVASMPPPPTLPSQSSAAVVASSPIREQTEVFYATCADAKRAGAAPLHRGRPGYRAKLDRDGDGTACE
jgi:hypothetical protein